MFELALLGLVAFALGTVFLENDEPEDEQAENDDDREMHQSEEHHNDDGDARVEGEEIRIDDGGIAHGGAGDDTIIGDTASGAYGKEGDDFIDIEMLVDGDVGGGAGNDSIAVDHADGAYVWGGDGDDTLIGRGGEGVAYSGGDGNDVLRIDLQAPPSQAVGVDGGEGDDLLEVTVPGKLYKETDPVSISGGEGDDKIHVNLLPDGGFYNPDDSDAAFTITDFNPAEDELLLTVPSGESAEYRGFSIHENVEEGITRLVLHYGLATGDDFTERGGRIIIQFTNVTGLRVEDIGIRISSL